MPPAHVLSACLALGVLTCTQDDGDDDKRPEDGAIAFDAPADAADGDGSDVRCHGTPVPAWTGTAERLSGYSGTDDLVATVRWELVETVGCVDRYQPSGTARYHYAIPGALCHQTTEPATAAIAAGDGTMTIDR